MLVPFKMTLLCRHCVQYPVGGKMSTTAVSAARPPAFRKPLPMVGRTSVPCSRRGLRCALVTYPLSYRVYNALVPGIRLHLLSERKERTHASSRICPGLVDPGATAVAEYGSVARRRAGGGALLSGGERGRLPGSLQGRRA